MNWRLLDRNPQTSVFFICNVTARSSALVWRWKVPLPRPHFLMHLICLHHFHLLVLLR